MIYIYLDESGDLGFDFTKRKTSKYFLVTMLCTENRREIERIIVKTFKSLPENVRRTHSGVFHAIKEKEQTRMKLFELFAQTQNKVFAIIVDKTKIYAKLKDEKHILYNLITNILIDRIITNNIFASHNRIILTASKRETNKNLNENFKTFIEKQTAEKHLVNMEIEIKTPGQDKCLQMVDTLSWAFYQKYENKNEQFYTLFKQQIADEYTFFK